MENDSLFNQHEFVYANEYVHGVNTGYYQRNNTDLISGKAERKYNEYINSKPYAYDKHSFKKYDDTEVISKSLQIIIFIFGNNKKILKEFEDFGKLIQLNNSDEVLSGCCEMSLNAKTGEALSVLAVDLPNLDNTSSVIGLVHEFMHYHIGINHLNYNKKYYYQEILPIFGEKIASFYMDNDDKDLTRKIENIRLDCISYHYGDEKNDYANLAKMMKNDKNGIFKNIISKTDFDNLGKYLNALSEAYGIGYLYAEALFQSYIRYPESRDKINNFLYGKCSLDDLLTDLRINAKNNQSYEYVDDRIRKLK